MVIGSDYIQKQRREMIDVQMMAEEMRKVGLVMDPKSKRFRFKESTTFYYDYTSHTFTKEMCDGAMQVYDADTEDVLSTYRNHIEQYVIKDTAILQQLVASLGRLKACRTASEADRPMFEYYKNRYVYMMNVMLHTYNKRLTLIERSTNLIESLLASLEEAGAVGATKDNVVSHVYFVAYYTFNILIHPVHIEHKHIYDAKAQWAPVLTRLVRSHGQ